MTSATRSILVGPSAATSRAVRPRIKLLYADRSIVVISKPSGVPCVPGFEHEVLDAVSTVRAAFGAHSVPPQEPLLLALASSLGEDAASGDCDYASLRAAHRLDAATSGVVAFAVTPGAHAALARMLQPPVPRARTRPPRISKRYIAVLDARLAFLRGFPVAAVDSGRISTPLRRHASLPIIEGAGAPPTANAEGSAAATSAAMGAAPRDCETLWRILWRGAATVRVELQPVTGRTHQLRLHAALPPPAGLGCPIVGDPLYGDPALATRSYLETLQERCLSGAARGGSGAAVAAAGAASASALLEQLRNRGAELCAAGLGPAAVAACLRSRSAAVAEAADGWDGPPPPPLHIPSPAMLLHAQELVIPDWAPPRRPPAQIEGRETVGCSSSSPSPSGNAAAGVAMEASGAICVPTATVVRAAVDAGAAAAAALVVGGPPCVLPPQASVAGVSVEDCRGDLAAHGCVAGVVELLPGGRLTQRAVRFCHAAPF